MRNLKQLLYFSLFTFFLSSCISEAKQEKRKVVIIAEKSDASTLNPVAAGDEMSLYLSMQIFQTLLGMDFESQQLVGVLAEGRPKIELKEGNQWMSYQLRPEARFGDGSAVTMRDVLFSLKANVCPLVNNLGGASYYGATIDSVIWSATDSLRITMVCHELNNRNEFVSGDFSILQERRYDSLLLLRNFSYESLLHREDLKENDTIQQFSEHFNSAKYAYESDHLSGSGAYRLKEWIKGQRIVLERKEDWWGDQFAQEHKLFVANAARLQYEVIPDGNTALSALQAGEVDFIRNISSKIYLDLLQQDSLPTITLAAREIYDYNYLAFNLNRTRLANLKLRKAIAHATPRQQIIETVFQNQASLTNVPLPSIRTDLINDTIKGYSYDLEKSKELIAQTAWKDADGDGVLEKEIDGKQQNLELTFLYNTSNKQRKAVGLILQNELKKLGIELKVEGLEWSVYLQRLRSGDFDICYGGKLSLPIPPDYSSSFHSKSANGGRNYANYQNSSLDSLIEQIGTELDPLRRKDMVNKFQEIVHQDLPYLYLLTPKKHIAFSKELKNANIYSLRPNFWAPELSW